MIYRDKIRASAYILSIPFGGSYTLCFYILSILFSLPSDLQRASSVISQFLVYCFFSDIRFSAILFPFIIFLLDLSFTLLVLFSLLSSSFLSPSFIFPCHLYIIFYLKMCTFSVPASFFPGAKVTLDPIVVFYDEFDALEAQLTNKLTGSAINLQPVELGRYGYEKLLLSVGQVANQIFLLRDVRAAMSKVSLSRCLRPGSTTAMGGSL